VQCFNVSKHPWVVNGRISEVDAVNEFMSNCQVGCTVTQRATLEEFANYLNFTYPPSQLTDVSFAEILRAVFVPAQKVETKLSAVPEISAPQLGRPRADVFSSQIAACFSADAHVRASFLGRTRAECASQGPRTFVNLRRSLSRSKNLSFFQLKETMGRFIKPSKMTEKELLHVFEELDSRKQGEVSVSRFFEALLGNFSATREASVRALFQEIVATAEAIHVDRLLTFFVPHNHPEVRCGLKSTDTIRGEFLECLDSDSFGMISVDNFVDYHRCVSACVPDDSTFETFLNVFRPLTAVDECTGGHHDLCGELEQASPMEPPPRSLSEPSRPRPVAPTKDDSVRWVPRDRESTLAALGPFFEGQQLEPSKSAWAEGPAPRWAHDRSD
jgi:hypothetical protein